MLLEYFYRQRIGVWRQAPTDADLCPLNAASMFFPDYLLDLSYVCSYLFYVYDSNSEKQSYK